MLKRMSIAAAAVALALIASPPAAFLGDGLLLGSAAAQAVPRCATPPRRCPTGQSATCQREGQCRRGTQTVSACLQFRCMVPPKTATPAPATPPSPTDPATPTKKATDTLTK